MLFTPTILLAGAATIALAALNKTLETYGFGAIVNILGILADSCP